MHMQSTQHSRNPIHTKAGTDTYMGNFNFNQLVHFTKMNQKSKPTKIKMCLVCCKNKLSASFKVWMQVCLLGGLVLPPEHALTPRTASYPPSVATTFFPAWPSTPSWHQKCVQGQDFSVPFTFLLLFRVHTEVKGGKQSAGAQHLCFPCILCLSICQEISSCSRHRQ